MVPPDAPDSVKQSATFHKSKANAFIFDAVLIKQFFDAPDPAQYFAVFLGAIGTNPTVVVAGLKDGSEPNTLVTRAAEDAGEHPRLAVDAKYPSSSNGPIYITE